MVRSYSRIMCVYVLAEKDLHIRVIEAFDFALANEAFFLWLVMRNCVEVECVVDGEETSVRVDKKAVAF